MTTINACMMVILRSLTIWFMLTSFVVVSSAKGLVLCTGPNGHVAVELDDGFGCSCKTAPRVSSSDRGHDGLRRHLPCSDTALAVVAAADKRINNLQGTAQPELRTLTLALARLTEASLLSSDERPRITGPTSLFAAQRLRLLRTSVLLI